MPRRKYIDKKNATTFALVYRPQNDPLIHDEEASDMVFKEVDAPNANKSGGSSSSRPHKVKTRGDLEDEFGMSFRANEGQAASYGVYYDDTEYDYMQHMVDPGGNGETIFVEAASHKRGKGKTNLEDALAEMDIGAWSEAGESMASTTSLMEEQSYVQPRTYQDQQDVPDAIAGFQPDMDPRLREVLEALEDDAYVDDEESMFAELAEGGEEADWFKWEDRGWHEQEEVEEDDGWETDDTIRPTSSSKKQNPKSGIQEGTTPPITNSLGEEQQDASDQVPVNNDWMAEFDKFKKDTNRKSSKPPAVAAPRSDLQSGVTDLSSLLGGRRKKRKGALTSSTGYSMTSSALARTEEQTLLDMRFDKIAEQYADADDDDDDFDENMSLASGMTGMSKASRFSKTSRISTVSKSSAAAPQLMNADMDNMLDDFLGKYSSRGKKGRVVRGKQQSGLEELDEMRKQLGPARLKVQKA